MSHVAPSSPVEQFRRALHKGNVDEVRQLLEAHAEVRAAVNSPIGHFDGRPVASAKKNLHLLDLLLSYGADLNLKSAWWAGGFGLLEYDCSPEEAAPLIARGATVDVFAAAHLGMLDRLRELLERDPSLVHARGGDGKTPLHCARSVEIAELLLSRGAEIDARDVDHESTPAQYLVREAPAVTRLLVNRGAWLDIFIAVGLRDAALVDRCLRDDPEALDHRTGQGLYAVAHNGKQAATREQLNGRRGDIYRWVFDHNIGPIQAAALLGHDDIVEQLLSHASPTQQLVAACSMANRAMAEAVVAARPDVVTTLTAGQMRLIADKSHANDTAAVALMLDLGFDPHVIGPNGGDALHWAAFHGNPAMVRALLQHRPAIGARDSEHHATALGWCIFGANHGWSCTSGDFATVATLLIGAGDNPNAIELPTGRDDLDAIIKAATAR